MSKFGIMYVRVFVQFKNIFRHKCRDNQNFNLLKILFFKVILSHKSIKYFQPTWNASFGTMSSLWRQCNIPKHL